LVVVVGKRPRVVSLSDRPIILVFGHEGSLRNSDGFSQFKGEYLATVQTRVFGVGGSNGDISGSIKSKMAADGHLGMTALSRVTFVSAGLSCR